MTRHIVTKNDAAHEWVREMNAIPHGMIETLVQADPDSWSEVTLPGLCDRVYVYDIPDELDTLVHEGEIISYDHEASLYHIKLDDEKIVTAADGDFEVTRDDFLPMWGTLWSFGDSIDDWWLGEENGISLMSECGFRIYYHEEFGYFFGIDGAGYDFYEAHWIPLYDARGLHWHEKEE